MTRVSGTAYPFGRANVDTDVIIPAAHLKTTSRVGLGRFAFETARAERGNVFDDPAFAGSPVLIAGDNFGCGSSREHAVWALADIGVAAIIAPSFSDIFCGNACKNGLIPVVLPQSAVDLLLGAAAERATITVDLDTMTVTTDRQQRFEFILDPFHRECLMTGRDEIDLTLARADVIAAFERTAVIPAPSALAAPR